MDIGAAALVAGTAIGGGFLALPYTVAPAGVVPCGAVMVGSWLYLLAQSLLVADLILDASCGASGSVGYGAVARRSLGTWGSVMVSLLFLVLMAATLVSQIARGGQLLSDSLGYSRAACSVALAGGLWAFSTAGPSQLVSGINALLTAGFVGALGVMFVIGLPLMDWSQLGYARWGLCWRSVPSVLQLFVYCEVVPTLCHLLSLDRRRIRRSIFAGSLVLLFVEATWAALGLGLAGGPLVGGPVANDPVQRLLARGGALGGAVLVLGACAIATTIIGTVLALRSFFADLCPGRGSAVVCSGLAAGVPLLIALGAQDVFFAAIDFAGAYPVALLWGCVPPLMALRLSKVNPKHQRHHGPLHRLGVLRCLLILSAAFVGFNAVTDLVGALGLGRVARWQQVV